MSDHKNWNAQQNLTQIHQIESGVSVLKSRRNRMMVMAVLSCSILIFSVLSLFVQQDFIYQWLGVSEQVRQLHIPFTVNEYLKSFLHQPDYLWNLFSWFGWLFLKLIASFIGAFISISLLKKISFFRVRFQSFILKFVAWLIAFIMLWSGLAYIQYDLRDDEQDQIQSMIAYKENIQQSDLYQFLQQSETEPTVQAYLLAQVALMHTKPDRDAALAYNTRLIEAEQNDPRFLQYGFKAKQLWTIQHQLYGKSQTAIAKSIDPIAIDAQKKSQQAKFLLALITTVFAVLSLIFYMLSQYLTARMKRITQQMSD